MFRIFYGMMIPTSMFTAYYVQIQFCHDDLGVNILVSNYIVMGECGKKPLFVVYMVRCIKCWCKILYMPPGDTQTCVNVKTYGNKW